MKKIIIALLLSVTSVSFSQDKPKVKVKEKDETQMHIKMHEQMAKAHQDAVTCLKSGKSDDECREAFHDMCKESGGPEMCGPMKRHGKKGKM